MAAKGLITLEEFEEKLLGLEEIPQDGRARAASPAKPQGALGRAGAGQNALLKSYAGMAPEASDSLTPAERHTGTGCSD
jgi:hypothetical protein